jgi:serine protease Do
LDMSMSPSSTPQPTPEANEEALTPPVAVPSIAPTEVRKALDAAEAEQPASTPAMPDREWYARHGKHPKVDFKRPLALFLLVLLCFTAGGLGGTFGVVALTQDSTWARTVRGFLNMGSTSEVRVPVQQNLRLSESSAVIDAAEKVSPAVVSITASSDVVDFFGRRLTSQETGAGTGFIITSDGVIATNKHVVADTAATYKVILNDGRMFDATVTARDALYDLAVLKINATGLPVVDLGSSADLKVGQTVIAVGNALGEFQNTVTTGIVSAKDRQLSDIGSNNETLSDLIQTDASINSGNSGGPLVNLAGQVVGINTAIATTNGGSVGLGFAISIDSVRSVLESVQATGKIVRPYLGVRFQLVNAQVQRLNNLTVDYGAFLVSTNNQAAVLENSPAAKAGLRAGDVILQFDGKRIDDSNSLTRLIAASKVGQTIPLLVQRGDQQITVQVVLEELPAS